MVAAYALLQRWLINFFAEGLMMMLYDNMALYVSYLGHSATSEEICSHFHLVQIHLLEHHPPLLLLRSKLFHFLQLNVFIGNDPFVDLTKVATT